jgi:hypothetical protein
MSCGQFLMIWLWRRGDSIILLFTTSYGTSVGALEYRG